MALPKWTPARTEALASFVGDESPISQGTVSDAAEHFETSTRSVSSKLRKMGYDVELASNSVTKSFSDEEAAELRSFVESNDGQYTYAQIAEQFQNGKFSAKAIQGKILSMELTGAVKPAPKPETVREYNEAEEAKFIQMAESGAFVEDIAEAMGRPVNSIRGKALSLLRANLIDAIPKQRDVRGPAADPLEGLDVANLTVEEIAEKIEKSPRGVKTMLTRRGLSASDYNGAAKREKADAQANA